MSTNKKFRNIKKTHKLRKFRKKSRKYIKINITKRKTVGGTELALIQIYKLDFILQTVYVSEKYFEQKLEPIKTVFMNEAINLFQNSCLNNEEVELDLRGGANGELQGDQLPEFSDYQYNIGDEFKTSGQLDTMIDRYKCFMNYFDTYNNIILNNYSRNENNFKFKLNVKQAFLKYVLFGQNGFNENFKYRRSLYTNSKFNKNYHPKVKLAVPKEEMANQRSEEGLPGIATVTPLLTRTGTWDVNKCIVDITDTDTKIFKNWSDIKYNDKNYVIDNLILCTIFINYIFNSRHSAAGKLISNIGNDTNGNLVPIYLLHTLVSVKNGTKKFQMTTFCNFDKDVEKIVYNQFSKICLGESFDFEKMTIYQIKQNESQHQEIGPHIIITEIPLKATIPIYSFTKITNKIGSNYIFDEYSSLHDISTGLVKYTDQTSTFDYKNLDCLKDNLSWNEFIVNDEFRDYYQETFPNFTNNDITFAAKMAMFSYYPTCFVMNYNDPSYNEHDKFQYLGAYDEDYDGGTYYTQQNIRIILRIGETTKTLNQHKKEKMKYNFINHRCHVWINFNRKIILIVFRGTKSNRDWEQDRYIAKGSGNTHERIRDMPGILANIYRNMFTIGIRNRDEYKAYAIGHSLGAIVALYASHTAKSYRNIHQDAVLSTNDDSNEEIDLRGGAHDEYFKKITPILFNPFIPLETGIGGLATIGLGVGLGGLGQGLAWVGKGLWNLNPWSSQGEPQQQVLGTKDTINTTNILINHFFKTSDKGLFIKVIGDSASFPSITSSLFQMNLKGISSPHGMENFISYKHYKHIFDFCSLNTIEKHISRESDINSIVFEKIIDFYEESVHAIGSGPAVENETFEQSINNIKNYIITNKKYPIKVKTNGINDIIPQVFSIYLSTLEQIRINTLNT